MMRKIREIRKTPEYYILCVMPLILMVFLVSVLARCLIFCGINLRNDTKIFSFFKAIYLALGYSSLIDDQSEERRIR
jgi:hypothetical protein